QDEAFTELLRSALRAYDFEMHVLRNGAALTSTIRSLKPVVVFIGVDLPEKAGFALCAQAKGLRVPVVLATATLPATDMALHAKLKHHADAYGDKRTRTGGELLAGVDALVPRGLPQEEPEVEEEQEAAAPPVEPPPAASEDLSGDVLGPIPE